MSKHNMRNDWLFIIADTFIILFFSISYSNATLPNVTATELADLLEYHEKNIKRVQIKYTLIYGSFEDDDISKGKFIPKVPTWSVDAELAMDFSNRIEYIREDQLSNGEHYVKESAFDGEIGTRANTLQPGSDKWVGIIREGPPVMLQLGVPKHWRAKDSVYWPIDGYVLSEIIRNTEDIKIKLDEIAGHQCYKITFLFKSKSITLVNGHQQELYMPRFYNIWLSPDRGMLPVRFERLRQNFENPYEINDKALPEVIRLQDDFREVAPGIWFPFSCSYIRTWSNHKSKAAMMTINEVLLNEDADVPTRVEFPEGTHVTDEIVNVKYTIGFTTERLLEEASVAAEKIRDVQKGHLQTDELVKSIKPKEEPKDTLTKKTTLQQDMSEKVNDREDKLINRRNPILLSVSVLGASFLLFSLIIFVFRRKLIKNKT